MFEAYIYDAVRTPRGRGKKEGRLHEVRPVELVRQLIQAILERHPGLPPEAIEDVILGCVTQVGSRGLIWRRLRRRWRVCRRVWRGLR
jgi:acetyl-CoA C-acetyltransferase